MTGIQFAVDYLTAATKEVLNHGKAANESLAGKHVVVIGGGDTGNDCLGTAMRHGAASVRQLEITPQLPPQRLAENPWPEYPMTAKIGYGQEEVAAVLQEHTYHSISTTAFVGAERGQVIGIETVKVDENFQPISGTEQVMKADLVLLAMGFLGPETHLLDTFNVREIYDDYTTNNERVLVAGDAKRGPSLVIWAIREGRLAAEKVDQSLRALIYQQI